MAPRQRGRGLRIEIAPRHHLPAASIDTALVIQSLPHVHRRGDVLRAPGRVVRPRGRTYPSTDRAPAFRRDARSRATHDVVARGDEARLPRVPGLRHSGAVLAVEARRAGGP